MDSGIEAIVMLNKYLNNFVIMNIRIGPHDLKFIKYPYDLWVLLSISQSETRNLVHLSLLEDDWTSLNPC